MVLQGDSKNWSPLKFVGKVCWLRQNCRKNGFFQQGVVGGINAFLWDFFAFYVLVIPQRTLLALWFLCFWKKCIYPHMLSLDIKNSDFQVFINWCKIREQFTYLLFFKLEHHSWPDEMLIGYLVYKQAPWLARWDVERLFGFQTDTLVDHMRCWEAILFPNRHLGWPDVMLRGYLVNQTGTLADQMGCREAIWFTRQAPWLTR